MAAGPAAADSLDLEVRAVALNPEAPAELGVGDLDYRGGVELTSSDDRFGGLSGLDIDADGTRLIAVVDRGAWVEAWPVRDADGRLAGLVKATIGPLRDRAGRPLAGAWRDAEEVVRLADGRFAVSFERHHRIWLYPDGLDGRPAPLAKPEGLARAPNNAGIEAMAELDPGVLLAVTENLAAGDGAVRGWLVPVDGGAAEAVAYAVSDGFVPTALAVLPGGDLLALERRYTPVAGVSVRLKRIARETVAAGAELRGREVARLEPPLAVDNFEGLAIHRDRAGQTIVTIVSDDNFNPLQRTLLLQFRLHE